MYQEPAQTCMSLEMLAHPAPWHGSPLQGIVIICSGTRRSSDSKEQVCTPMVPEEMLRTPGSLGTRERWGHGVGPGVDGAWKAGWEAAVTSLQEPDAQKLLMDLRAAGRPQPHQVFLAWVVNHILP